ncbi:putative Pre-rRNA-processing protein [Podospora fimiseda]|uniref:Pre-rRNA-processing protein IPI3 n=1 Tax=Podospora fimiseda TaxID=252190 RepID=A0AAN7BZK3_9PEZI|nr:putative Pre-rRNA-processing protein [Podospora fimiseda]
MLSEEFVSTICGPPLSSNTAIAKDVSIYCHTLSPTFTVKSSFKKSSVPVNCLAVSETHIFAAQHAKAYVHVYSRLRGNQEAFVAFPERIQCLTLAGDVLVMGTTEGRLMLWETCTGRLVSTPARHVQPVSCVIATPTHILTGSDDSDIHVWSLSQLLEFETAAEAEPERSLSNHRAAITALAANESVSSSTNFAVSASKDKSCIIWNYQTGDALRTLIFPTFPLCLSLDPASRAVCVSCEDGSIYLEEFFGDKPLLGPDSEQASTVVQVSTPLGATQAETGSASCLSMSYDGTTLLTGHAKGQILRWDITENKTPVELANLNAAVTNVRFVSPFPTGKSAKAVFVVKPAQAKRKYVFDAQIDPLAAAQKARFDAMLMAIGFTRKELDDAVAAFEKSEAEKEAEEERKNRELADIAKKMSRE